MIFYLRIWQWIKVSKVEITLFFLCFFAYGYFFHGGGNNQNATYDQIRSIAEYGELSINSFAYNTHDVSIHNGHIFPNKAPGLTFLGVPSGFVLFQLKKLFLFFMKEDAYFLLVCHLISWLTVGFISASLCVGLFKFICCLTQCATTAFIGTMGYALGTTAFAYSTILYAHQVAAAFSFIAFYLVFVTRDKKTNCFSSLFSSGLLSGYAVITEYPNMFVWLALFVYVIILFSYNKKYIGFFVIGSLIPAIILLIYNYLCYGNPIHFSYFSYFVYNADIQPGLKETVKTISFPSLTTFYKITFDPFRGIFYYCPFLLTFFPGVYFFLKKKGTSKEFLFLMVVIVYFFVFNASYQFWFGGWSLGPRHLVSVLPFMVLLSSFFIKQFPKITTFTVLVSFFLMIMAVSVTPETPSDRYRNPVIEFYLKNFFNSNLSLNKMPIFTSNVYGDAFNSFNIGSILHLPSVLSLIPFYLIIIVGTISFIIKAKLKISDVLSSSWSISRINTGVTILKKNATYFKLSLIILLVGILGVQITIAILWKKETTLHKESNYVTQPGFLGLYYGNKSFDGKPKFARHDVRIALDNSSLSAIFPEKQYSVIWSGRLYAPKTGTYKFFTESDDSSFLYINDKQVVDNGGDHGIITKEGKLHLTEGYHDIKIKYFNSMGKGHIKVSWEIPDGLRCILDENNISNYIIDVHNNEK